MCDFLLFAYNGNLTCDGKEMDQVNELTSGNVFLYCVYDRFPHDSACGDL